MDVKTIAKERTQKLLRMARDVYDEDQKLAKRYVSLARKIAMKHRFPLGSIDFCRKCETIFIPGKTVTVRTATSERAVRYLCKACGTIRRFGYAREKRAKRKA